MLEEPTVTIFVGQHAERMYVHYNVIKNFQFFAIALDPNYKFIESISHKIYLPEDDMFFHRLIYRKTFQ